MRKSYEHCWLLLRAACTLNGFNSHMVQLPHDLSCHQILPSSNGAQNIFPNNILKICSTNTYLSRSSYQECFCLPNKRENGRVWANCFCYDIFVYIKNKLKYIYSDKNRRNVFGTSHNITARSDLKTFISWKGTEYTKSYQQRKLKMIHLIMQQLDSTKPFCFSYRIYESLTSQMVCKQF